MSYSIFDLVEIHASAMHERRTYGVSNAAIGRKRVRNGWTSPTFGVQENGNRVNPGDVIASTHLDPNTRTSR